MEPGGWTLRPSDYETRPCLTCSATPSVARSRACGSRSPTAATCVPLLHARGRLRLLRASRSQFEEMRAGGVFAGLGVHKIGSRGAAAAAHLPRW